MQRWKCLIYKGTLETSFQSFLNCYFFTFRRETAIKNKQFKETKTWISHSYSDKAFKGTVVNRGLPSLHDESDLKLRLRALCPIHNGLFQPD